MKSARFLPLGVLIFIFAFSSLNYAAVPQMINYQGKITTPGGALIDTTIGMTFAIYTDSTGTDSLWSEAQPSVVVQKGVFSVSLGSVNPIPDSVFSGDVRYLGVKVGTDAEMTPRKAIASVAYAFRAGTADGGSGGGGGWVDDGNVIRLETDTDLVGIGTLNPTEKLEVAGTVFGKDTSGNFIAGIRGFGQVTHGAAVDAYGGYFSVDSLGVGVRYGVKAISRCNSQPCYAFGVFGEANNTSGPTYGGVFSANSSGKTVGVSASTYGDGSGETYGVIGYGHNDSDGNTYGGYFYIDDDGTGKHYGVSTESYGLSDSTTYGYYGFAENTSSGDVYAGFFEVSSEGTGTKYGVYAQAPLSQGYAGYFSGNVSVTDSLDVAGTVKLNAFEMPTGAGAGKVLTSDANGVGTWQAGTPDGDWTFRITDTADTTVVTGGKWGIARAGNFLYGNADSTHVNLGVEGMTGCDGYDLKYCTVGGGLSNAAFNQYTTVGGGYYNRAWGEGATVGGGDHNQAYNHYTTVAGGYRNDAWNIYATVAGGYQDSASGEYSTVGGGKFNVAGGNYATVEGGGYNTAGGFSATVGGGESNSASGGYSTVPGGEADTAAGLYSLAAGRKARITSDGDYTFAFGRDFTTSTPNAVIFHNSVVPIKVGIGTTSPAYTMDVVGDVNINSVYRIGGNRVLSDSGSQNIMVGVGAGTGTTGSYGTFVGYNAGSGNSGDRGTFVGTEAGSSNNTGSNNTYVGYRAGYLNTSGYRNVFMGNAAGRNNTSGNQNVFIGDETGFTCSTGVGNVFIGWRAAYSENVSNKLYIANGQNDANVLIYGDFSSDRVGINNTSPGYALDVDGDINVSGNIRKGGVAYTHPDYVFEPDYELMSLDDLKKYVQKNKCLPNVISAEDVKENNGYNLDELLIQMLEKVEEQTLYIFELEERISELEKEKR